MRQMTVLGALGLLALVGCGAAEDDESGGFVYQNQIFSGTVSIQAAQSGSLSAPAFSWAATGEKHVVCAIFDERIQLDQNHVSNTDRVVWLWHSGLGSGREGNLLYSHGVAADNGAPEPLLPGSYYWAVWAMDLDGFPVASSVEYTLAVPGP
jgi:hypothetical protein